VTEIWEFIAGAISGVLVLLALQRWRRASMPRRWLLAAVAAGVFALAFAALYSVLSGRSATSAHVPSASASTPAAQSMDAAVASLETRLAQGGGADSDWALLAQAYEFEGRSAEAERARAHQLPGTHTDFTPASSVALLTAADAIDARKLPASAAPAAAAASVPGRLRDNPRDAQAWVALADQRRAQHDNAGARDALEQVIAFNAMTAQTWADYADVRASLAGGSLEGAAGTAIDQALALDPSNAKALWLKASQAHEAQRYEAALGWWRKLKTVLPADGSDQRVIDANITEDRQLAARSANTESASGKADARISGTISISAALAARVAPGATLFIYAKAVDSPGPPLAVMRTALTSWPVSFTLDDSMAMLPSRRLSQFDRVVIEARISRSGQATPATGDLFTTSAVLRVPEAKRLSLVIDRQIG
jgi:cytochrome c-type biogenesis protein CcmH